MSQNGWDGRYPVRCKIVDVTGQEVFPGIEGRTPDKSKPYVGKEGLAEEIDGHTVKITLDDGNIIHGYECWWEPLGNQWPHITQGGGGDDNS